MQLFRCLGHFSFFPFFMPELSSGGFNNITGNRCTLCRALSLGGVERSKVGAALPPSVTRPVWPLCLVSICAIVLVHEFPEGNGSSCRQSTCELCNKDRHNADCLTCNDQKQLEQKHDKWTFIDTCSLSWALWWHFVNNAITHAHNKCSMPSVTRIRYFMRTVFKVTYCLCTW